MTFQQKRSSVFGTSVMDLEHIVTEKIKSYYLCQQIYEECMFSIVSRFVGNRNHSIVPEGTSTSTSISTSTSTQPKSVKFSDAPWMLSFYEKNFNLFNEKNNILKITQKFWPFTKLYTEKTQKHQEEQKTTIIPQENTKVIAAIQILQNYAPATEQILRIWILLIGFSHRGACQNSKPHDYLKGCTYLFHKRGLEEIYDNVLAKISWLQNQHHEEWQNGSSETSTLQKTQNTHVCSTHKEKSEKQKKLLFIEESKKWPTEWQKESCFTWLISLPKAFRKWILDHPSELFVDFSEQEELKNFLLQADVSRIAWILTCTKDCKQLFTLLHQNRVNHDSNRWFEFLSHCSIAELVLFSSLKPLWMIQSFHLAPWNLYNFHFLGLCFVLSLLAQKQTQDDVMVDVLSQKELEDGIRFLAPVIVTHPVLFQRVYGRSAQTHYLSILQNKSPFLNFSQWTLWAQAVKSGALSGHIFSILAPQNIEFCHAKAPTPKTSTPNSFFHKNEKLNAKNLNLGPSPCLIHFDQNQNQNQKQNQNQNQNQNKLNFSDSKYQKFQTVESFYHEPCEWSGEASWLFQVADRLSRNVSSLNQLLSSQDENVSFFSIQQLTQFELYEKEFWENHCLQARSIVLFHEGEENPQLVYLSEKTNNNSPLLTETNLFQKLPPETLLFIDDVKQQPIKEMLNQHLKIQFVHKNGTLLTLDNNDCDEHQIQNQKKNKQKQTKFQLEQNKKTQQPFERLLTLSQAKWNDLGDQIQDSFAENKKKIQDKLALGISKFVKIRGEIQNKMTNQMASTIDAYEFSYGLGFIVMIFTISVILFTFILVGLIKWSRAHIDYSTVEIDVVNDQHKKILHQGTHQLRDYNIYVPQNADYYYYTPPVQAQVQKETSPATLVSISD